MNTLVLKIDPKNPDPQIINEAGEVIRQGGLVVFPTETVYGLAADAFNETAVRRVFEAKGRPVNNPLPVQVAGKADILKLATNLTKTANCLIDRFMPGPLTIVLNAMPHVSALVTAGTGKVGIRIPDHPVALALIKAAGTPIVAPSANASGQPPPTTAEEALGYLKDQVEIVLDAGPTQLKIASTVVDATETPVRIIRHGSITEEMLSVCFQENNQ
jgi:L-threonylcarbamoyladenylate synthase